jgi:uncharacterized protein YndB with AHSA1/START domain
MKINQEIIIKSTAKDVFEALTNSEKFTELSGVQADIDAKEGGKFTCFGGMISGQTIEIEPSQLLVQAWRAGNWDKGIYSIIKIELESIDHANTKLLFEHSGFPEGQKTHLESGWHERYWEPLKKYLEK